MFNLKKLLRKNFDAATMARGEEYAQQGMVHKWKWLEYNQYGGTIKSAVDGSNGNRYTQSIDIELDDDMIEGECTCPVEYNCKHVVAVLFNAGSDIAAVAEPAINAAKSADRTPPPAPLPYDIESWITTLSRSQELENDAWPETVAQRILYAIAPVHPDQSHTLMLDVYQARLNKSGDYGSINHYRSIDKARSHNTPKFVHAHDLRIFRQLQLLPDNMHSTRYPLQAASADLVLEIMATGRAFWLKPPTAPLTQGTPRPGICQWERHSNGDQRPTLVTTPPASVILPCIPPVYIDTASGECGLIETTLAPSVAATLAASPLLPAKMVERIARELQVRHLQHLTGVPEVLPETVLAHFAPTPVLTIGTSIEHLQDKYTWRYSAMPFDHARLQFDYRGELVSDSHTTEVTRMEAGQLLRMGRNTEVEQAAREMLRGYGMVAAEQVFARGLSSELRHAMVFPNPANESMTLQHWTNFVEHSVPALRAAGWRVNVQPTFRFNLIDIDDWYADIEESKSNWFDLEIGIEVEGKKVSLIPILVKLIQQSPRQWQSAGLQARPDDEKVVVSLPDGKRVALPLGRIKPIFSALYELYMRDPSGKQVRLSKLDAARLVDMEQALQMRWVGGERLREMGRRMGRFVGIAPVATPTNFHATLRTYQQEGLAWLQFLREYELAGVLADDMGLGKTVQTLAHVLTEKNAGRLLQPVLVVAPTSLMNTWASEAARFAPSLRVLISHGGDRHHVHDKFSDADMVLTTYALLNRDEKLLKKQHWHSVILDEAQNIKNPKTKAAQIACTLNAQHRLCLSGTPLENHLGELWSLFHFLLPGFLGDEKTFQREFRRPIEKEGALAPREFLARRIKPFLLRRTKELVATELPAKTLITHSVELSSAQADLYETVRAAMDKRVREQIAASGLAKSHIIVLDALLKLRQICCDPRLLASVKAKAKNPPPSAKLNMLLDMLDELIAEDRSILVFSQFTSMLTLIEAALDARAIEYVKLTGQTKDRKTPVDAFQAGKVKLFLISLKAGGTGLTLTAADTVIHYDPWWNPAVENQATDRAHRIGQDKPVFVYKLVAKGTVEERIVEMQERKGVLAAGLLAGDGKAVSAMTADDLQGLFQPLVPQNL